MEHESGKESKPPLPVQNLQVSQYHGNQPILAYLISLNHQNMIYTKKTKKEGIHIYKFDQLSIAPTPSE